jgi:hypothetical protein
VAHIEPTFGDCDTGRREVRKARSGSPWGFVNLTVIRENQLSQMVCFTLGASPLCKSTSSQRGVSYRDREPLHCVGTPRLPIAVAAAVSEQILGLPGCVSLGA